MVAISIERLAVFYERILNIIKLQKELARFDDMPDGINDQMRSYIDGKIEEGINQATKDLLKGKMRGVDSGRKNELNTELQNTLNQIAKRLDSGFQFDVRGGEPSEIEEGEQETQTQKIDRERYQRISAARDKIRSFKIQAKPILSLPRDSDEPLGKSE